jgi:hypothetical protein
MIHKGELVSGMPALRQVAISAEEPAALAGFYKDVFELEQIGEEEKAESLVKIEKHEVSYE